VTGVQTCALPILPEKEDRDQEQSIESVMNWLKIRTNWLIILDNVEDLAGVSEIFTVEAGRFLLTTRSQITGTLARQLDLRKMEPEEGALFLLRRAKCLAPGENLEKAGATERGVAAELSRMLDGLPLALDQAGAYIEETGCCLADYLELYRRQQAALLARRGWMSTDHPHSVMTTLNMACARAAQANPAALALLRLCAFLHPDAIPEEVFTDASFSLDPVLQLMAEDTLALDAAMATLRCYSLLQRNPGNKTLTIHRLVQAVLRDRMNEEEQRQWAEHVVQMIAAAVPSIEGITGGAEWERGKRYFSQVLMSISLIETWKLQLSKAEQLLHWMGVYLNILGQYTQAESLLQKAMELARQSSGSEGPGIAEHMHELAVVYIYQGKYLQAEQLLLDALDIYTRALGSETFKAGECLNDLGALYIKQSQYTQKQLQCTQAEALLLHSLAICENILGSDYPHVAYPLTNLAVLYYHQGNYTQAEALNRRALRIREQALTVNHFLAANNLLLLGMTYREQGCYAQAEPLLQQSLQIREESLGKEHAVVGQSLHELAMLYIRQGRFHEALPLLQRALSIREQLGANHPDTLTTSNAYTDLLRRMDLCNPGKAFSQRALSGWT